MDDKIKARFFANIKEEGDCWIWTGVITRRDRRGQTPILWLSRWKAKSARQLSLELAGRLPVRQTRIICGNALCVNPAHIEERTKRPRGLQSARAKLTQQDAEEIRLAFLAGQKVPEIAGAFRTSRENVRNIISNRSWKED